MIEQRIEHLFPGWRVVREIGADAAGRLYELERDRFGIIEKAALKVMVIPNDSSVISDLRANGYDDESIRNRLRSDMVDFASEYKNMRKIAHANIVICDNIEYEVNPDGFSYTVYLKMELLTPLIDSLKSGFDGEKTAITLAKDICRIMEMCESHNIIHRDIKPQNLFVNEYGEYKLGDFGIACEMDHSTNVSKTWTYKHMFPEVYNDQTYDHNVDIYSLGLVLYWLLNEKRMPFVPLPPAVPTTQEKENAKYKMLKGEKIPAPKYGSAVLKRIVLKACEADKKNRYQNASEMLADLETIDKPASAMKTDTSAGDEPSSGPKVPVSNGRNDVAPKFGSSQTNGKTTVNSGYRSPFTHEDELLDYLQKHVKVPGLRFMPSYLFAWIALFACVVIAITFIYQAKTGNIGILMTDFSDIIYIPFIILFISFFVFSRLRLQIKTKIYRDGDTGYVVFPQNVLLTHIYAVAVDGKWIACVLDKKRIAFPLRSDPEDVVIAQIHYYQFGDKRYEAKFFKIKRI